MRYLKPDRRITGLIPAIALYVVLALSWALFSFSVALDVISVMVLFYAFYNLKGYRRTTNPYYIVIFAYLFIGSIFLFVLEPYMLKKQGGSLSTLALFLMILVIIFGFWMIYLLFTKRIKWRGREVMELIARNVEESDDGYTERPRPCGSVEGKKFEIASFVSYLKSHLVFLGVEEHDRYVLLPVKMGREFRYLWRVKYEQATWVAINKTGEITVHISKEDYLDYKVNLSYDQLSNNLGNLIEQFYDEFIANNEVRIIDKVNEVNVGYFS